MDDNGQNAATRHCSDPQRPKELVKWKDVLTNEWKGPDPILIRSRGAVCIFPQNEENLFWVPERLTRTVLEQKDDMDHSHADGERVNPRDTNHENSNRLGRTTLGNHVDLSAADASDV